MNSSAGIRRTICAILNHLSPWRVGDFTDDEWSRRDSALLLRSLVEGDGVGVLNTAVRRVEDADIGGDGTGRATGGGDFMAPFSGDVNGVLSCLEAIRMSDDAAFGVDKAGMRS